MSIEKSPIREIGTVHTANADDPSSIKRMHEAVDIDVKLMQGKIDAREGAVGVVGEIGEAAVSGGDTPKRPIRFMKLV